MEQRTWRLYTLVAAITAGLVGGSLLLTTRVFYDSTQSAAVIWIRMAGLGTGLLAVIALVAYFVLISPLRSSRAS